MNTDSVTNVLVQQKMSASVQQMPCSMFRDVVHWPDHRNVEVKDLHDTVVHLDYMVQVTLFPLLKPKQAVGNTVLGNNQLCVVLSYKCRLR